MNALDPTVAEFRERLKHQRTKKSRRLKRDELQARKQP
jgi:hypothetical protein